MTETLEAPQSPPTTLDEIPRPLTGMYQIASVGNLGSRLKLDSPGFILTKNESNSRLTASRALGFQRLGMALARLQLAAEESKSELFEIVRRRSVRSGDFKLASGIRTNLYFDLKATIMNPQGGALIARAFLNEAYDLGVDFVGGLALGAVPTLGAMAAISQLEGRPVGTFFVRQKPKEHGTRALVEGLSPDESLNQRRALVVDDVATKGGSIMEAIIAARQAGAIVNSAMVIVDREKGAEERLREEGVRLFSLFRESDFA